MSYNLVSRLKKILPLRSLWQDNNFKLLRRDYPQIKIEVITPSKIIVTIVPTAAVECSKKLYDITFVFFQR